jgi:hypothetical protein
MARLTFVRGHPFVTLLVVLALAAVLLLVWLGVVG